MIRKPRWRLASASVQGSSHEKLKQPCQDAHRCVCVAGHTLVAAVADGAGSAPFASEGAAISARSAVDFLTGQHRIQSLSADTPDDCFRELLNGALSRARDSAQKRANELSVPINHLASTLIVVVAGKGFLASAQIGDGAVIVVDAEGTFQGLSKIAESEFLNETVFLSSEGALEKAALQIWRGNVLHVALLSDGLQMVALQMPGGTPHAGFFNPLFKFLESEPKPAKANEALSTFLRSPRLRERTDDDLTLVLASRITGAS